MNDISGRRDKWLGKMVESTIMDSGRMQQCHDFADWLLDVTEEKLRGGIPLIVILLSMQVFVDQHITHMDEADQKIQAAEPSVGEVEG